MAAVAPVVPPAVAAAAGAAPPGAVLPFPFAKSPAALLRDATLNMGADADVKIYNAACKRITSKNELFDLSPDRLMTFLEMLTDRANEFGWNHPVVGIMQIPDDPLSVAPVLDSLLEGYGQISIERIRTFEESYINGESRAAQDTEMLYKALMASLTETAKTTVVLNKKEYMVGNEPSGNLLLRLIIRESSLDSNATTTIIRGKLSRLDLYMPTIKSNIKSFNVYVKTLLLALSARGETTSDLLVHLFAAYKAASDKSFRKYATEEQVRYEEGQAMTADSLMSKMQNRYETLMDKGEWDAPSEEEEQLMVMKAELAELKNRKPEAPKNNDGKSKIKHTKKTGKGAKGKKYATDPEWLDKNIKPSPIDKVMTHKGAPWYWCGPESGGKCAGCWRKHKASECKGTARKPAPTEEDTKKLKLIKALQTTIMEESDDEDESDEEVSMKD